MLPRYRRTIALGSAVLLHCGVAAILLAREPPIDPGRPSPQTVELDIWPTIAASDVSEARPPADARGGEAPLSTAPARHSPASQRASRGQTKPQEPPVDPSVTRIDGLAGASMEERNEGPWRSRLPSTGRRENPDLSRIDLFAGVRTALRDAPISKADRVDRLGIGLEDSAGLEAVGGIVVLEAERRVLPGMVDGLELDGRRLSQADRHNGPLVLECQADGALLYRGSGYRALIARDGSASFFEEGAFSAGAGPLVGDGRGGPGRGRGGGALEEGAMRVPLENPVLPLISGVFDLERGLRAARHEDTLSSDKAKFLERTRPLRERMRAGARSADDGAGRDGDLLHVASPSPCPSYP